MKNRERGVNFYDLLLKCRFRGLETEPIPIAIAAALSVAREIYSTSGRPNISMVSSGRRRITLDDWQYNQRRDEHYLVMSCADPDLSDVYFKDLQDGTSRIAGKEVHEAIDQSCHLVIKPGKSPNDPALLLQTSGSGVSAERICMVLTRLVKAAASTQAHKALFERSHPDGAQGKTLRLTAKFTNQGHQSQYLEQILKTGRLEGVELISEGYEGIDGDAAYQITSKSIKVEVVDDSASKSVSRMKKLFTRFKDQPPNKARVFYRETLTGAKKNHLFATNDLEKAFSRREIITFDSDIQSKYSQVSTTIIDKMRELI